MNKHQLFTELMRLKDAAVTRQDELAERYKNAWGFYRGELPAVLAPGDVAARQVMMEAFESVHPSLVAIFTDDQKAPVAYTADRMSENKIAQAVTKAVHAAALGIADWEIKIALALKEVLISGNQAGLVGYDSKISKTEVFTYDQAPAEQVLQQSQMLSKAGYTVDSKVTFDEVDGQAVATGTIQGISEYKFPTIELIPFKDFYLHPKATNPQESHYSAYSEEITQAEAIKRGYKRDQVEKAENIDTNNGRSLDTSLLVAGNLNGESIEPFDESTIDQLNSFITIYHHYWKGCYNTTEEKHYHVVTSSTEFIQMTEIAYCPLIWGAMSLVPNSAHGESLYDRTKSTQENTTRARRSIQRSADFAAYPDMEIVDSLLTPQAKAALNDRSQPGKVYTVKQKGAVNRIPVADVPQAMQILAGEFQQDAERSIQGSAGQAAAEAATKTQQSGIAIALTQAKDEINENAIAKVFAETFIKPAYRIFLFVLQEIGGQLDVDGQQIPFRLLRNDKGLKVDIKSAGDRANAANNVMQCYLNGLAVGALPANFTDENKYTIFADYLRAVTGGEDVSRYITPPSEMPKPSELQQKMQALLTALQFRHAIATTKIAETKVQTEIATGQQTLNDAAKKLAEIEAIMEGIDIDKIKVLLEAKGLQIDATAQLANNATEQTEEPVKE